MNSIFDNLVKHIEEFQENGSGWVMRELLRLDLHTYVFDPLRGSTYIPLPSDLLAKQALLNIVSNDDKCFIWCIIAAIYGDSHNKNHNRVLHYREHEHKLNMSGIEMPMKCTK